MLNVSGLTESVAYHALMDGAETHVKIKFLQQDITFTDDDISATNGIVVNSTCNSNTDLSFGDTICKEVTINFINNGQFTGFDWSDEFTITFDIVVGQQTGECVLGHFFGEKPVNSVNDDIITFVAYDKMKLFDAPATTMLDNLVFPCSLGEIFSQMLYELGFESKYSTSSEYTASKTLTIGGQNHAAVEAEGLLKCFNTDYSYGKPWNGGHYFNILPGFNKATIDRNTGEPIPDDTGKNWCSDKIRVIANTDYYFQKPGTVNNHGYYVASYKSDGSLIEIIDYPVLGTIIYTCPANASTIRVGFETGAVYQSITTGCVNISDPDKNDQYLPYANTADMYKSDYYKSTVTPSSGTAETNSLGKWDDDILGGEVHFNFDGYSVDISHKLFQPLGYWQYDDVNKTYYSDGAKDYVIIPEDDDTVPDMYAEGYETVSYNDGIVATETCIYIGQDGRIYCKSGQYGFWDEEPSGRIAIPVQSEHRAIEKTGKIYKVGTTNTISLLYAYIGKITHLANDDYVPVSPSIMKTAYFDFMYDTNPFDSGVTYRHILSKVAEMNGCFALIRSTGKLELRGYSDYTSHITYNWDITSDEYYRLLVGEETVPAVDGVRFVYTAGNLQNYIYPDNATNICNIYDNNLVMMLGSDNDKRSIATFIISKYTAIGSYHAISMDCIGNLMIEPGDIYNVIDKNGNTYRFPVFYHSFVWNGGYSSYLECTGGSKRSDDSDKLKAQYKESNQFIKKYTVQSGVGISEDGLTVSGEKSLYNISQARDIINNGIYDDQGMDASFGSRHKIYDKVNTAYVSFYPAVNMHVSGADSRVYSPGFVIEGMHGGSSDWKIGMNYKRIEGETYTDDSPGDPTFGVIEGSATLPERYILNGFSRIFGDCVQNNLTTEDEGYVLDPRAVKATNYERVSGNFTGNSNVSKYYKVIGNGMVFVSAYTRASNSSDIGTTTTTIYQCDAQKENSVTLAFDSDRQQTANTARPAASCSLARYFEDGECIRVYHSCTKNGSNAWCHAITTMGCQLEEF